MLLNVRLYGHLKKYAQSKTELQLELPEGMTLGGLLAVLGVPHGEVGVALANGTLAGEGASLAEGATVDLTPVITGGR